MNCWIFDVDGVITDLYTKEVKHPEILSKILDVLENREPVGIITGRTLSTLERAILNPLEDLASDKKILDLLCYQGEFGGLSVKYENGNKNVTVDLDYSLPKDFISNGEAIINEYKDIVFFAPKQTFLTAEMQDEGDIDKFKAVQDEIAQKMQKLVDRFGLSEKVEVHNDQIAVNVKNRTLNKHLATKNFLSWLKNNNLIPEFYYVFGDNESDLQIGSELHSNGKRIKFIYVGEKDIKGYPFEIIRTQKKFDEGTIEYLRSI